MKIPNNIDTGEMVVILRAKANHEKFTQEEREYLRDASRMIDYLVDKVTNLENSNSDVKD